MHMVVHHHPKFYATRCNHLSIVMHIIGGVTAILASYIGFLVENNILLYVAVLAGIVLHFPSAMWQARNLHGAREIMQPGYMFVNLTLLIKEIDVLIDGAASFTVMEMGLALGVFSLVRFYYFILDKSGTAPQLIYDRACICAVVTNMPFVLGMFCGIPMFIGTIALWNILIGIFQPSMRAVMRVTHNYHSVLPPSLKPRFHAELRSCLLRYPNRHEAVARSVFNCLAEGKDYVSLEEIAAMTEHWGIDASVSAAKELFDSADTNHNGHLEFEEFRDRMWFVWEHVEDTGELEGDEAEAVTTVEEVLEEIAHEPEADCRK